MAQEENVLGIDFNELLALEDSAEPDKIDDSGTEDEKKVEDPTEDIDINKLLSSSGDVEEVDEDADNDDNDTDDDDTKDEGQKDTDNKTESPDKDTKKGPFTLVYAKSLVDQGILSSYDEKELESIISEQGEAAALMHLMSTELDNRVNDVVQTYEEDFKEYAALKDLGLDSVKARELIGTKIELDKITDDVLEQDENKRKQILEMFYKKTTKFPDKRIEKLIENHVALGEDEELAKEFANELRDISKQEIAAEKEQVRIREEQAVKQRTEGLKAIKSKIQELDEVIPGYKINKQTKDKIEKMLLEPATTDAQGNKLNAVWAKRAEDPFTFDAKLAYLLHTGVFDGKMEKLVKTAKSQAVRELDEVVKSQERGFKTKSPRFDSTDSDNLKGLEALI